MLERMEIVEEMLPVVYKEMEVAMIVTTSVKEEQVVLELLAVAKVEMEDMATPTAEAVLPEQVLRQGMVLEVEMEMDRHVFLDAAMVVLEEQLPMEVMVLQVTVDWMVQMDRFSMVSSYRNQVQVVLQE